MDRLKLIGKIKTKKLKDNYDIIYDEYILLSKINYNYNGELVLTDSHGITYIYIKLSEKIDF